MEAAHRAHRSLSVPDRSALTHSAPIKIIRDPKGSPFSDRASAPSRLNFGMASIAIYSKIQPRRGKSSSFDRYFMAFRPYSLAVCAAAAWLAGGACLPDGRIQARGESPSRPITTLQFVEKVSPPENSQEVEGGWDERQAQPVPDDGVFDSDGVPPGNFRPRFEIGSDSATDEVWPEESYLAPPPRFSRRWQRPFAGFGSKLGFFGPTIDGRHRGRGTPLERESWRNRPFHADWLAGGLFASDPIPGRIRAGTGFLAGFRLGWDWDHFYGFEARFGYSSVALEDARATRNFGDEKIYLVDFSAQYYPWGDARWRPFFTLGLGFADVRLLDDQDRTLHETLFAMPFGLGVKYRWDHRMAFRLEFQDNVAFGGGSRLDTLHNLSLTAGFEYRFGGGARRSYYPWQPSKTWF